MSSDLYQTIGGAVACRKLAVAFYARVERDPLLRPLFPKTFTCAIEEFAAFLVQFLGGPNEDAQRRWWLSLRESHLRFKIGRKERDAWMNQMVQAVDDVPFEEPVRSALLSFFARASAYVVNQEQPPAVPECPSTSEELDRRWAAQQVLDEAVAAIRAGDADRAIELAEGAQLKAHFKCNRAVLAALLAVMLRQATEAMLDYVREKLRADPALSKERYSGRTLLHEAAGAGSSSMVELLLRLGADPDVIGAGGHTPLYCVANECSLEGAGEVVRTLVQAGADVNAHGGVKHCSALHMAARRGNVEVAEALLDCGADVAARDSLGDSPLRRAVNCDKTAVAALLLARGADRHSVGSKGLTPVSAARTNRMTQILQTGAVDLTA